MKGSFIQKDVFSTAAFNCSKYHLEGKLTLQTCGHHVVQQKSSETETTKLQKRRKFIRP